MRRAAAAATMACLLLATASGASEDEAWLHRAPLPPAVVPLLALLVDTSAGMDTPLAVLPPYDPTRDYVGESGSSCRRDRVYWRLGPEPLPDCEGERWVSREAASTRQGWRCVTGEAALASVGVFIAPRAAQWEPRGAGGFWRALVPGDDGAVECVADRGFHGAVAGRWFAADGEAGPWSGAGDHEPDWQAPPLSNAYVFYTGNYLAYLASDERIQSTRYAWLARRIVHAAQAGSHVDLVLARFSHDGLGGDDDARGGMVALAPTRLPEGASGLGPLLDGWNPAGPAPISEALVELARWLAGDTVIFGDASQAGPGTPFPSVPESRTNDDPGRYRTPFEHACRPVLTAVATVGRPGADGGGANALPGVLMPQASGCGTDCAARVTSALAAGDLLPSVPGRQRSPVRWLLSADPDPEVEAAARAARRLPLDLDGPDALVTLMAEVAQNDAGEAGPARVSAAGLENRAFAAPDSAVYLALSSPSPTVEWPGNLRRYGLVAASDPLAAAAVTSRDGRPAFDQTGRLRDDSWSEWSAAPDGADPTSGGAAAALPPWQDRVVFSDLADAPLRDPRNRLAPGNAALTRERLGLTAGDARDPGAVIEWLLGRDVFDADFDGDRDETRQWLGDAGLRPPQVVRYAPEGPAVAFLATNDGMLHAFNAETGTERWAFAPSDLLRQAAARPLEGVRFDRLHGLDGPVELLLRDQDQDGRIEAASGDQAWLFVALGRGGTGYYALDVSDPAEPRLLWRLGPADLPGFAQSWPAPVPARMRFDAAAQGPDTRVLVLAGGHDPAEDAATPPVAATGAALAVVAARSGAVLWRAGGTADALADLEVPALHRSLPAAPRVLDTDGDGLHDRAYVVDAGGQLLRFDFVPSPTGDPTVSARRLADLGAAAAPGDVRRFQVTPDAVLERRGGQDVLALAFGSGWISKPRSVGTVDRFYVVFDPLQGLATQPVLTEQDLADVTEAPAALPADAAGWMFRLAAHGAGEKVTGQSLTFDHRVRFSTYQPLPPPGEAPCGPPAGTARLYTLDVRDGSPVNHVADGPVPDEELLVEGMAPPLVVSFPSVAGNPACIAMTCSRLPAALLGGRTLPLGYRNDPARTSWRQLDADAE